MSTWRGNMRELSRKELFVQAITSEMELLRNVARIRRLLFRDSLSTEEVLVDDTDDVKYMSPEQLELLMAYAKAGFNAAAGTGYRQVYVNKVVSDYRMEAGEISEPQEGIGISGNDITDLANDTASGYSTLLERFAEGVVTAEPRLDDKDGEKLSHALSQDTPPQDQRLHHSIMALARLGATYIGYEKYASELWYRMSKGEGTSLMDGTSDEEDEEDAEAVD